MIQGNLFCFLSTLLFIFVQIDECSASLRIVGGYEAPAKFGRFHTSLQNLTDFHVCGGAVVSEQHLVTAAHCVLGVEPEYIKVVVGTTDLDAGGKTYSVASISIHNEYNLSLRRNDIAIVKVNEAFNLQYVDILKLDENELIEGDMVAISGFGSKEPHGESSRQMYAIYLPVFSQETCRYAMRYTRELYDDMVCTFTRIGQGTCHGDSGGPLMKDDKLVGLVSWGIPCAVGFPDVHTRTTPYSNWIKKEIQK